MEEKKIDLLTAASLMTLAVSVDGIQDLFDLFSAVPIVGWAVGPITAEYFGVGGGVILASWFFYLGVPFAGKLGTAAVIEFIPIINAVPAYSAATMLTILAANNETVAGLLSAITQRSSFAAEAEEEKRKKEEEKKQKDQQAQGGGAQPSKERAGKESNSSENTQNRSGLAFKEPAQTTSQGASASPNQSASGIQTNTATRQQFSDITPKNREEEPLGTTVDRVSNPTTQTRAVPREARVADSAFQNVSDPSIAQTNPPNSERGVGLGDIANPPAQPDPTLGTSLESGLQEIEKRAKENPNEVPHYFSRDKNGTGQWKTGPEGGHDHVGMPTKELDALREAAKNGGSCAIVHTHPKSNGPNAIPSIQDAIMENREGKGCENIAVDSNGNRWKFETTDEFRKRHEAFEKKFIDMDNSVKGTPQEKEWNAEGQKALAMRREGRFEDGLDHMIREGLSGKYGKGTQDRARELANDGIARTARDYNRDVKRGLTKEEAEHYIKRWGQEGFRITRK